MDAANRQPVNRAWPIRRVDAVLALLAAAVGTAAGRLPLLWAAGGLIAVAGGLWALANPLAALAGALILGPTKPFTDVYYPAIPLDLGQLMLIAALGAWLLHAARRRALHLPHSPFTVPLVAFIGAASLSIPGALSAGYALRELAKWVQMLLVLWLVLDLGRHGGWRLALGASLAAAAVQAAIGVWQFGLRGDGPEHFLILDERFYRAYGTFEQPNPFGGFLGMMLPVAAGLLLGALWPWLCGVWAALRTQRPISLRRVFPALLDRNLLKVVALGLLVGLLLAGLLASWSRGAWLGVAAAAAVMVVALPRRWWVGALLAAAAGVGVLAAVQFGLVPAAVLARLTDFAGFTGAFDVRGVDINDANYAVLERLAHWQAAREMARAHFWTGIGFGNYEPVYPIYRLLNWEAPLGHAHNVYLNLLAETGIIGLSAYVALWVVIIWRTWRLTRQATDPWHRGLGIGLMGSWAHLTVHQLVDKLTVANLHLHMGVLLAVLTILIASERVRQDGLEQING